MAFSRIKSSGWSVNERQTSAQATQLDINVSKAVDKTGDNVAAGGGITGEIDVKSGGSIQFLAGSQLGMNSSSVAALNGIITIGSGGTFTIANGATETHAAGSTTVFNSGSVFTVNTELNLAGSSSILNLASGATVTAANGSTIIVSGEMIAAGGTSSVVVAAGSTPGSSNVTYITPQTRTIMQPLIVNASVASNQPNFTDLSFADKYSGETYYMPLSKLINGATITTCGVSFNTYSVAPTSNNASITLVRSTGVVGTNTFHDIATLTIAGALSTYTSYVATLTGLSEVVDDSQYSYHFRIVATSGAGAAPLLWGQSQLTFSNITSIGQS